LLTLALLLPHYEGEVARVEYRMPIAKRESSVSAEPWLLPFQSSTVDPSRRADETMAAASGCPSTTLAAEARAGPAGVIMGLGSSPVFE
jgi:hypothetical protein